MIIQLQIGAGWETAIGRNTLFTMETATNRIKITITRETAISARNISRTAGC